MGNQRWGSAEEKVGRRVRALREERGLSQAELAHRVKAWGVSLHPSAIAKIEARGVETPRAIRLDEAVAIAWALGVTLEELVEGDTQEAHNAGQVLYQALHEAISAVHAAQECEERFAQALAALDAAEIPPGDREELQAVQGMHDRGRKQLAAEVAGLGKRHGEHPEEA